jgi:hypothetical protein
MNFGRWCLVALLLIAARVHAHPPRLSTLTIDVHDGAAVFTVQMSPPDQDHDGRVSVEEIAAAEHTLAPVAKQWLLVRDAHGLAPLQVGDIGRQAEQQLIGWAGKTTRPLSDHWTLDLPHLGLWGPGHRTFVTIRHEGSVVAEALLSPRDARFEVNLPLKRSARTSGMGYGAGAALAVVGAISWRIALFRGKARRVPDAALGNAPQSAAP